MYQETVVAAWHAHRITGVLAALGIIILLVTWARRNRKLDTIPGPRGWPLIGIGYQLPPNAPSLFREWAVKYGDLFKLRVGWYNWVVINSPEAVAEILEKQSAKTSSKAPSPVGHDVVTGGNRMPTMPYGPQWRNLRTIVRQVTSAPKTATFIPSQEFEAKQLLFDLANDDGDQLNWYQHMRRYAFSIIMTNTFGTRVKDMDHPDVHTSARSQAILRRTSRPGAFLIDEIPPLGRLPKWLQPGRSDAVKAAKEVDDIKMDLWERLRAQVESGKAPHCYAREIFESRETWYSKGSNEKLLAWVSGGLVEAGFSTTAGTLHSLVLYLAANRGAQTKAQDELMRVVGPTRLPSFDDIQHLPYVRACVKEVLRMNPIVSPGVRAFTDQDVVYKEHVIPKGTVLMANTAFLHFDSSRFEKPEAFMPERYLEHPLYSSDYAAMSDPYKRDHFTFSSGRRVCPGARLAENSLNIALAGLLWAFEILPPVVDGEETAMDLSDAAYLDTGFTLPKPFAVRFRTRGDDQLRLVRAAWETASKEGYELRGMPVDIEGMVGS